MKKYSLLISNVILTILVCYNFFSDQFFWLHFIIGILFFLVNLYLLTAVLSKFTLKSWIFALLIMLGIIIVPGSIIYYFYQLNAFILSLIAVLISAIAIYFWLKNNQPKLYFRWPSLKLTFLQFLTFISYLIFIGFIFKILINGRSDIAVSTPWTLLDKRIFILYFSATLILIIFFFTTKLNNFWKKTLLSLHFFLSFSIALIVYKLGFGYDPFIHQKTAEIISQNGFILPKPLYYLGQYCLEVFLHKITLLPIEWIDRLLLPILAAIYLPNIILFSFKKTLLTKLPPKGAPSGPITNYQLPTLIFLAIPYSFLTFTTPQNLSLFFCLIIIFLSFRYLQKNDFSWLWLGLISLIALAIHALSGLPILLFAIAVYIFKSTKFNIFKILFVIFSTIIIPLAFLFINLFKNYALSFQFSWPQITANIFYWQNNFRYVYDLVYFYGFNLHLFIIIFIGVCLIIFRKKINQKILSIYIGAFLIAGMNYLILKNFFVFEQLIYYERADYALRLIVLMFLFLMPLIIIFWAKIIDLLKNNLTRISLLTFLALIISANFYLSYPRYDNIFATHGVNVSKYDFQAAQYIHEKNQESYVVLANQNTSVAAVKLYGFEPIYNGHFYYPIPTGSELYDYFLKMVDNEPKIDYINQVKNLTGVDTVYFVLPNYWTDFENLKEKALNIAKEHFSIEEKIYIFKY